MEKLSMHSPDFTEDNIKKIAELFPNCVTESKDDQGNIKKSIDFDLLRQELSKNIVEGPQERYSLNWPGKREALLTANAPIAKTLRPCREESVDFENTQNLFIEGDNLDALKLMQETYLGKIKMIYIDPPYNTGNDFVYKDDFAENTEEFLKKSNQKNEEGNRLVANTESNGRFHSDWLSMMYPRLKLARNLLKDDGVIFISIDDNEIQNIKHICNEIFGEQNFLGCIVWNSTKSVTNTALISVSHNFILIYVKDINHFVKNRSHFRLPEDGTGFENPDNDPRGPWKADPFQVGGWRPNQQYEINNPNTGKVYKPNPGCSWKNDYNTFQKLVEDNRIVFGVSGEAGPQRKRFLSEAEERGKVAKTWWDDVGTTTNGTQELKKLFDGKIVFSNPKPVDLIEKLITLGDHENSNIILDFVAGSCTTAHAVLNLNKNDKVNRKFIMVQLPEPCDEDSEAFKAGYKTIAEIGKERIRRAGKKIKEENALTVPNLEIGFRVLKVDSSNMQDVYYNPDDYSQDLLSKMADNIKPDRTDEDLLLQVLLDWGVDLSLPVSKEKIAGNDVFFVSENALVACFAKKGEITEDFCKELTKYKPLRVVFRDSGFKDDSMKINVEQIFKLMSPYTEIKTI
jgi:adenine-specific DNA-methyltransferase